MDIATILGIIIAFGALYATINIEGAHVEALLLPGPMLLVLGATIGVGIATGTFKDFLTAVKALPRAFKGVSGPKTNDVIAKIVGYAEMARSQSLLALESAVAEEPDPFIAEALQNIADGTDADEIRITMEDTIATTISGRRVAGKWFTTLGGYAPTIGIVGTVVSLTHVLENLEQPETLGPLIAAAFVATLWGLLSANFIWLPIGGRLTRLAEVEYERMNMITEGMLAVQAGSPTHIVEERMRALSGEPAPKSKSKDVADEPVSESA